MGKLLLWVVLIALAWLGWSLFRVSQRKAAARQRQAPPTRREPDADSPAPETMTRCARCGVYLPAGEALRSDAQDYCSPAHRDAGPHQS